MKRHAEPAVHRMTEQFAVSVQQCRCSIGVWGLPVITALTCRSAASAELSRFCSTARADQLGGTCDVGSPMWAAKAPGSTPLRCPAAYACAAKDFVHCNDVWQGVCSMDHQLISPACDNRKPAA